MSSSQNAPDTNVAPLDRERLLHLYGDDFEMLQSSIEMFLDEVTPVFPELKENIEKQDWEVVTTLTHQLRPWLGMVGLTALENKLCEIEQVAKEAPDYVVLSKAFHSFNTDLDDSIPALKSELQRIR